MYWVLLRFKASWLMLNQIFICCPCRESNSNAHVFPSVRQSIACTGWFPVHTYVGISKNAMPNAGGHGTYQTVWRHKDASLQHRRPHSARDFFPSSPCICICVRIPQCEVFVFIESVSSTRVTCRPNTTDASTCWRASILRFSSNHMKMQANFC